MLVRIVKMTFKEENVDDFKVIFKESKNKIRAFKGCHHVELLVSKESSNVFFTLSHWHDEDCLNNYRDSELFSVVWSNTKALFAENAQAWSLEQVTSALSPTK